MKTASDEDLVTSARRGSGEAFAVLTHRYVKAVRTVAFHIVRDHHASEDVAQEVFVAAFQRLDSLRVPSLFGRWILKIARNYSLRAGGSRHREVPIDHAAEVACPGPDEPDTGEIERLAAELMRLPEREQRLLMLRYFNGHSVEEIAKITGSSVGTVTKQLSRGYARLRERLSEVLV